MKKDTVVGELDKLGANLPETGISTRGLPLPQLKQDPKQDPKISGYTPGSPCMGALAQQVRSWKPKFDEVAENTD